MFHCQQFSNQRLISIYTFIFIIYVVLELWYDWELFRPLGSYPKIVSLESGMTDVCLANTDNYPLKV